jgi:hypothetical protein
MSAIGSVYRKMPAALVNDAGSDNGTWPRLNATYANDTESAGDEFIRKLYLYSIPPILIFCLVTFIVNTVIVVSSIWIRRPLSPTLSISISLASADAYASLIVGMGLVINSLLPVGFGVSLGPNVICYTLVLEAFRLGGIISSVAHLTALAINHYIGIPPLRVNNDSKGDHNPHHIAVAAADRLLFCILFVDGGHGLSFSTLRL